MIGIELECITTSDLKDMAWLLGDTKCLFEH